MKNLNRFFVILLLLFSAMFTNAQDSTNQKSFPCEDNPKYSEFDFWLGEWNVYNKQGKLVGTNKVYKIANDCALYENWKGGSGINGKSINYYNPQKEKWVQVWVDGSGGVIRIEGNYSDRKMILEGIHILKDGSEEMFRGTWFNNDDGTVRQFFESSKDNGKTWKPWFDGLYKKEK